jgi:hypothetical protein
LNPPRFRERLEPLQEHLPEAAAKVIEEELEKLQVSCPTAADDGAAWISLPVPPC